MSREKEMQEMRKVEDYIKDLRKDMDQRLGELKVQVNVLQQKAAETVTKRPLLSLGVAFVAGMAVGIALSKSDD